MGLYYVIPIDPQVQNPPGNILTDTLNWQKISGEFIATGNEDHITIGNFRSDLETYNGDYIRFLYVDDVSVMISPNQSVYDFGNSWESLKIHPNPAGDFVSIQIDNLTIRDFQMEIINSLGQSVKSQVVTSGETIDVSSLPLGSYVVQVSNDEMKARQKLMTY